jgi:hypothetical protein
MILAVHHVNTRDTSVVGNAAWFITPGFKLKYKFSDTRFSTAGGVSAILDWRGCGLGDSGQAAECVLFGSATGRAGASAGFYTHEKMCNARAVQ